MKSKKYLLESPYVIDAYLYNDDYSQIKSSDYEKMKRSPVEYAAFVHEYAVAELERRERRRCVDGEIMSPEPISYGHKVSPAGYVISSIVSAHVSFVHKPERGEFVRLEYKGVYFIFRIDGIEAKPRYLPDEFYYPSETAVVHLTFIGVDENQDP